MRAPLNRLRPMTYSVRCLARIALARIARIAAGVIAVVVASAVFDECWPVTSANRAVGQETSAAGKAGAAVTFVAHRIGAFRSEACGVADFTNDGKLDIVAGPFLYVAPDWIPTKIRELEGQVDEEGKGYYWDFMNAPWDVDGDGWTDVVSCSWHGQRSNWFRNPGKSEGLWAETLIEKNGFFEHGDLWDIDGDGQRNEILPAVTYTQWYELGTDASGRRQILRHQVSDKKLEWGCGVGDVNGDGRPDLLRPNAWLEAPRDPRAGEWREHPLKLGHLEADAVDHTPQICVYDVNGDGANDILTSSAHKYGIFWYEQDREGSRVDWRQHVIDSTWSQSHSLAMADLNGDGVLDLVSGKRFFAHDGKDPGAFEPLGVYWYELKRGNPPTWTKHAISHGERIGSGMNIPIVDLDRDGDLDIVVTGKWGGPVWFENKMR